MNLAIWIVQRSPTEVPTGARLSAATALTYRRGMSDHDTPDAERWLDLDVKLAYQERLIRELDGLVREFGARLDQAERELAQLKQAIPPPLPLGAANEPPPHY
jgi:uncharacterized coiled-coil protein SlyX